MDAPDLDAWVPEPTVRVAHCLESGAQPASLWGAAGALRLSDTRRLGRLIRWRIPGLAAGTTFDELFSRHPFLVLDAGKLHLVSGIVGRIWTLRRDYPRLADADEFRGWSRRGTVRVVFANWVATGADGASQLHSETRVEPFGAQGRIGLRSVRPLIGAFHNLVVTDAMTAARRAAERGETTA